MALYKSRIIIVIIIKEVYSTVTSYTHNLYKLHKIYYNVL